MTEPIIRGSRRQLLQVGVVGTSVLTLSRLLSACGGSASSDPLDGPISQNMALVQRWVPDQIGPGAVRLPISLADNAGLLLKGPRVLTGDIRSVTDDSVVVKGLTAQRASLGEGLAPFWVFNTTLETVAFFTLVVDGGPADGAAFQVSDPSTLVVPRSSDRLPALDTPTADNHQGVEPYCTQMPEPCPFHEMTLAEALQKNQRVVLIVGTPAHCQTGVCAPVLDGMVTMSKDLTDVIFIHADVYLNDSATTVAPTVEELKLTFEPVVWVTDSSGVITHRFEGVWHPDEVRQALI